MATTYDEERILQLIQHLNDSRQTLDVLLNTNNTLVSNNTDWRVFCGEQSPGKYSSSTQSLETGYRTSISSNTLPVLRLHFSQ